MSTTLPLSTILNVAVVVSPAGTPGPSFNQALIVGPSAVIPSVGGNSRLRLYNNLTAMATDGFSVTSPEYLAAEVYFGQNPSPFYLWVGRQDLTAIAVAAIGAASGSAYALNDIVTVIQAGGSLGQLKVTGVNGSGAVTALAVIQGSQGTGYSVGSNLNTSGGSGTGLEVNITSIGETPLQAVNACRTANPQWYACMFAGSASDADHESIAAYIEGASPSSVYFLTTGDPGILNGVTPNLLSILQAANYRRTFSVYSTTQGGAFPNNAYASAAPMGLAMGLNTGAAGSYFDLMFKRMSGVGAEPLTQSQVNAICGTNDRTSTGLNGNVFLIYQNGAYSWMQPAVMAGGSWFDEVLQLDMLASDMQTSGVNLLTSVPALPITNAGVLQMKAVLSAACDRSVARGFIAPSGTWQGSNVGSGPAAVVTGQAFTKGYFLYAPSVSSLSAGQRSARQLPPITALVIEAQSGHSLGVTVLVQQ
jgi:hypothetical protein